MALFIKTLLWLAVVVLPGGALLLPLLWSPRKPHGVSPPAGTCV